MRKERLTAVSQNVQPSAIAFKRTGSDCSRLRSDPIAELRLMAPKPGTGTCCPPSESVFVIFVGFCEFRYWECENGRSIKWRTSSLFILRPNGSTWQSWCGDTTCTLMTSRISLVGCWPKCGADELPTVKQLEPYYTYMLCVEFSFAIGVFSAIDDIFCIIGRY